ncbi:MAG: endolytic transglycosylase MltG, partial [Roseiarcus sp.]
MSDKSDPSGDAENSRTEKPSRGGIFGRRASTPIELRSPPKPRRPRRTGLSSLSAFLSFVLIGAVIGLVAFAAAIVEERKTGPLAADKVVLIEREDDEGPIADQLERAGVIESAPLFSAMTLVDGKHGALKRGEYSFKAGVSMREVEQELLSGKVLLHPITLPEGLTTEQIVQRLRDNDVLVGDVKELPREGSLLPETYKFARGETRQALLTIMAKAQAKAVDEIWKKRAPDLPIKSPGELVTLASIVEKETGKVEERPRVAGVFVNRLLKHMKLQSDPTIVYGLVFGKGTLGHSITKAELDQATPYNTYNIDGLPPGPICNPGKAALEAVANPSHSKELYFVADGTGGHAFAETLDQHLKNVAHWRQIEKDAKDRLAPEASPPGFAPPTTRGDIAPLDPEAFGALAPMSPSAPIHPRDPKPAGAGALLASKLAKLGASLEKREALLGAGGALSATKIAGKSMEELGVVVTGVNDQPETVKFPGEDDAAAPSGPVASVPLSPAALADEKAREARWGDAPAGDQHVVADSSTPTTVRPRAFDASEGTRLDPLLNKTYDLSYAKVIP